MSGLDPALRAAVEAGTAEARGAREALEQLRGGRDCSVHVTGGDADGWPATVRAAAAWLTGTTAEECARVLADASPELLSLYAMRLSEVLQDVMGRLR